MFSALHLDEMYLESGCWHLVEGSFLSHLIFEREQASERERERDGVSDSRKPTSRSTKNRKSKFSLVQKKGSFRASQFQNAASALAMDRPGYDSEGKVIESGRCFQLNSKKTLSNSPKVDRWIANRIFSLNPD